MIKNKVELKANFDELADFIGSAQGWGDRIKTPYYIGELIKAAHGIAANRFNTEAAAVAVPLGFRHMYEWGTAGINPTDNSPSISPNSKYARLWIHRLTGQGANRGIDFTFRPSTVPVPRDPMLPTSSNHESKKHIFFGKAWITEFGIPVVIKPKIAQALMIPIRDGDVSALSGTRYSNKRAADRGYFMYNNTVHVPGSENAGNFSMFWQTWWNTEGKVVIDQTTSAIVDQNASAIINTGRVSSLGRYVGGKSLNKTFKLRVETAKAKAYAQSRLLEYPKTREWQLEEFSSNSGRF